MKMLKKSFISAPIHIVLLQFNWAASNYIWWHVRDKKINLGGLTSRDQLNPSLY